MKFIDKIANDDFAPGIPDKNRYKDIPAGRQHERWKINIQKHKAEKAGLHWDLRLNPPDSSDAYSWAVRNWPGPGDKSLAVEQPTHKEHYMGFEGEIEEGYGAGHVSSELLDTAEILESKPDKILFNIYEGRDATRYMLKKLGGKDWILYNYTTTIEDEDIPTYKPKTKSLPLDDLRTDFDNEVFAPKLDGSHNIVRLRPNKRIDVFSYRESKRSPKRIDQSYRTELYKRRSPKELGDTILRTELYIPGKSGNEVAQILNSNVWKARKIKQEKNEELKPALIDIVKFKGDYVEDRPYGEKLQMLKEVASKVPELNLPKLYKTQQEKQRLLEEMQDEKHPETKEGVIIYKLDEPAPYKAKKKKDWDVLITGVYPASSGSKYEGSHIGGFIGRVESEDGPKIKVGTGLDDETRRDAFLNPEKYVGEWAKVEGQRRTSSGKIYAPSYKGLRAEKFPNLNIKQRAEQNDIEEIFKLSKKAGVIAEFIKRPQEEREKEIKEIIKKMGLDKYLEKTAVIKKENGKYVLYTKDGSRVLGRHDTYKKALAQERAIQASKHGSLKTADLFIDLFADSEEENKKNRKALKNFRDQYFKRDTNYVGTHVKGSQSDYDVNY